MAFWLLHVWSVLVNGVAGFPDNIVIPFNGYLKLEQKVVIKSITCLLLCMEMKDCAISHV